MAVMPSSFTILLLLLLTKVIYAVPVGDRVAFYVSRNGNAMKMETTEPTAPWVLEETIWTFDKYVDDTIPITVYDDPNQVDGHALTLLGDENIVFWFFAYDSTEYNSLAGLEPTQYDVYQNSNNNEWHIWKNRDVNISTLPVDEEFSFLFYAFEYDDKYLDNITLHNCGENCSLIPAFDPEIYSYYVLVPDDTLSMYVSTEPSENVTILYDDPTYLLSDQDALEHKVSQIVDHAVPEFENEQKMNRDEAKKILLQFYKETQVDNDTINLYANMSVYDFTTHFSFDANNEYLIEEKYKKLEGELNKPTNKTVELSADGLLHDAWTPVTVDIHYDLHHYRIFVVRKEGDYDLQRFKETMDMNRDFFLARNKARCPKISADALIQSDIPVWWDPIRVYVVSFGVILLMGSYIMYDRYSYFKMIESHKSKMNENSSDSGDD